MTSRPRPPALERLAAASSPSDRLQLIVEYPTLEQAATVHGLCDLAIHLLHVDLDRAQAAAQSAGWLSKRLKDSRSLALSTRAMGNVLLLKGKTREALEHYSDARTTFASLGDSEQIANTHLNEISALLNIGDTSQVLQLADRTREIFTELSNHLGLARLDNNLGVLYYRQEDYEQARVHWQHARDRFETLGKTHDAAIAIRNLAVAAISLNDYRDAVTLYEQARDYCEAHGLHRLIHEVDYNIAYLYFLRGDHERALAGYREARQRSEELGDLYHAALCDLDEAELYLELNLVQDAAALSERAAFVFARLDRAYESAKASAFRGIAASRLGDPHTAIEKLRTARSQFHAEGNVPWEALTYIYESLVYQREGRLFEARRAADQALDRFAQRHSPVKTALCHLILAQLNLLQSRPQEALVSCNKAAILIKDLGLTPIRFQVAFILGEIHDALAQPTLALEAFSRAESLLQEMRSRIFTEELRVPLLSNRLAVYDRLLTLLTHASTEEPATFETIFEVAEKAKARSISDLFAYRANPLDTSTLARSSLVEKIRSLREELTWYYKRLAQSEYSQEGAPQQRLESLGASVLDTEKKLAQSLAEISRSDLEFGALESALTVTSTQIQEHLRADEVVLEYFVGQDVVFLLAFGKEFARYEAIAVPEQINELRRLLDFQHNRFSHEPAPRAKLHSAEATHQILGSLHQELITPALEDLDGRQRVIIVPHSFLSYLPFQAFHLEGELLSERFEVSFVPSAADLFLSRRSQSPVIGRERALALLDTSASDRVRQLSLDSLAPDVLAPDVPNQGWRQRLESEWGLIHLALPASYRYDNPALSTVSICGDRLTILDLLSLSFRCNVLVATDCGRLPGRSGNGDEVIGLIRGLLYAGPKVLILPLWRPRAAAADHFLRSFYGAFTHAGSAIAALTSAQALTRERYPHPSDWAAWVPYAR